MLRGLSIASEFGCDCAAHYKSAHQRRISRLRIKRLDRSQEPSTFSVLLLFNLPKASTADNDFCHVQATQEVVTKMPIVTNREFEEAVQAAKDAFPAWKRTPVPHRQRIMFKFQQLIKDNMVSPEQLANAAEPIFLTSCSSL